MARDDRESAPLKRKLPEAPMSHTAYEAEERLQAQLAKKLKVKKVRLQVNLAGVQSTPRVDCGFGRGLA